jgi:drug/metabolite transporter (DMT)-like permease
VPALSGEALLIIPKESADQGASLSGDLLVLLSIICVSVGYVSGARLSTRIGSWAATSWSLVIAGIILLPLLFYLTPELNWQTVTPASWAALGYLVIFICILGYVCWYWAIGQLGVAKIAPLQFAQPIVSMSIGLLFFNEALTTTVLIACLAILGGILMTKKA